MDLLILVLLGTQDKPFTRLLDIIEELIQKGIIKEKVVVQAGTTKYDSMNMEIFDLVPSVKMEKIVGKADLIITHGGVGSIMDGIKKNKKVIAVPRLVQHGEHVNDHQIQIIQEFVQKKLIIGINDPSELENALKKAKTFKPKVFISNNSKFVSYIDKTLNNLLK